MKHSPCHDAENNQGLEVYGVARLVPENGDNDGPLDLENHDGDLVHDQKDANSNRVAMC